MPKATPIDVAKAFESIRRLEGRTPDTTAEESRGSFAMLEEYRDGGIFISHFAGRSNWERHGNGDEVVYALEGATALILWVNGAEERHDLGAGELLVVPENTWHRFETDGVKILTVTPLPTDHTQGVPSD